MLKMVPLFLTLLMILAGCSQDLHFKIHFRDIGGLAAGDPLVVDDQPIGQVTAVEAAEGGGHLVSVAVNRASINATTVDSNFYVAPNPNDPAHQRIEVVQTRPGGKPLAEGVVVEGANPGPFGSFPLGEIFKEFGNVLRDLGSQVERFRQEFEKFPHSEEAKKLEAEWRRLMDEIRDAQNAAEGTLKKDVLPKLQDELENLKKRLQELEQSSRKKGKPLET